MKKKSLKQTERLLDVVHQLRRKCPWDRKQTHKSLKPYLLEEAYETLDAIDKGEDDSFREELGDLLLQVVLHAEITAEKKRFTFEDVAKAIADKMIRRHPHVFDKKKFLSLKDHSKSWTALKNAEKPKRLMLEGIPRALPALQLSQRYGEIAGSVGFDWQSPEKVWEKVDEELKEFSVEVKRGSRKNMEMELGDVLFSLAQLARHLKIDAEAALKKSAGKFQDRFTKLEKAKRKQGKPLTECSAEELEMEWDRAKRSKGSGPKVTHP